MFGLRKWVDNFLTNDKFSEWVKDYKGQLSYGRIGGNICLMFAVILGVGGFCFAAFDIGYCMYFSKTIDISALDKTLSYCSMLSLQFLGAAVGLYIPSKATEISAKKNAPDISETVVRLSASKIEDTAGKI